MSNPLLEEHTLPPFSAIQADQVVPAMRELIQDNKRFLDTLLANMTAPSWASLVAPLEERGDRLDQAWAPVSHLNGVMNSDELRQAYTEAIALLTEYGTELSQHQGLFAAYETLAAAPEFAQLNSSQQTAINNALRDFRLGGVALSDADKARFAQIQQRLSELSTLFSNHVLDSTQAWFKHITAVEALAGLPESALAMAAQMAQHKNLDGYVITLDFPSYFAVMTHADNRELRRELYTAYVTPRD